MACWLVVVACWNASQVRRPEGRNKNLLTSKDGGVDRDDVADLSMWGLRGWLCFLGGRAGGVREMKGSEKKTRKSERERARQNEKAGGQRRDAVACAPLMRSALRPPAPSTRVKQTPNANPLTVKKPTRPARISDVSVVRRCSRSKKRPNHDAANALLILPPKLLLYTTGGRTSLPSSPGHTASAPEGASELVIDIRLM